jgi:hypothetical protein
MENLSQIIAQKNWEKQYQVKLLNELSAQLPFIVESFNKEYQNLYNQIVEQNGSIYDLRRAIKSSVKMQKNQERLILNKASRKEVVKRISEMKKEIKALNIKNSK